MHPEDLTDFPADDSPLEDSALTDNVVADGEIAAGEIDDAALRAEIEQLFGAGAFDLLNDDLANIERQVQSNSLEDTVAEIDAAMPQSFHAGITLGADSAVGSARKALLGSDAKHVVFKLGESRYAVPISNVIEIQRVPNVTSIPNVPDWVEGVCNLRGEIISVLDLRSFLSMEGQTSEPRDASWWRSHWNKTSSPDWSLMRSLACEICRPTKSDNPPQPWTIP
jgi:hypothetical protein